MRLGVLLLPPRYALNSSSYISLSATLAHQRGSMIFIEQNEHYHYEIFIFKSKYAVIARQSVYVDTAQAAHIILCSSP